jgi:hypothetical protein
VDRSRCVHPQQPKAAQYQGLNLVPSLPSDTSVSDYQANYSHSFVGLLNPEGQSTDSYKGQENETRLLVFFINYIVVVFVLIT